MQMTNSLHKRALFFALAFILIGSISFGGQRTARVGDPSGSSSPKMKTERRITLTPERIKEDFDMYRPVVQFVNTPSFEQFKKDYESANKNNTLYPGQFVAAYVTAKLVSQQYTDISLKPAELIKGMQAKPPISTLQILQLKGLTEKQAHEVLKETAKIINENRVKTR